MDVVNVIVERSSHMKIPASVPEFEVPVLQAIHGAGNVRVLDRTKGPDVDPESAMHSLARKYGRAQDENGNSVLQQVYPTVHRLADSMSRKKVA